MCDRRTNIPSVRPSIRSIPSRQFVKQRSTVNIADPGRLARAEVLDGGLQVGLVAVDDAHGDDDGVLGPRCPRDADEGPAAPAERAVEDGARLGAVVRVGPQEGRV